VALSGKRGHGKSTLAHYLIEHHGFQEFCFANPLKKAVAEIFGFSDYQLYDPQGKETIDPFWGVTPREVLQVCGTELFRDRLPQSLPTTENLWIKALFRKLQDLEDEARVVVSDCRFPDEWKFMRALGAKMVRVVRPRLVADEALAHHPSETALDNLDLYTPDEVFVNDGTSEELVQKFSVRVQHWIQPHI